MGKLLALLLQLHLSLIVEAGRRRSGEHDERGDVPGWVLVTIMTVGLIAAITAVAQPQLTSMLRSALNSVK